MQKFFTCINSFKTGFLFVIISVFQVLSFSGFAQLSDNHGKIRTIVIDAGHGGKDSGALGKKSMEKDIALSISLLAGKYIEEKIPEVKVLYTRTTDVFIPLHERAKIANDANADLFISVHVNSNTKTSPFGTSTHVLGLHRMNENFEVAKRENSVILMEEDYNTRYENFDPNSPESYIMFSLMQDVYFDQSIYFGQMVQNQFRERARRKDRGVKQQGLLVLAQTSMPGVLIETGFISNQDEEKYLNSEQGQDYLASAIYRAFRNYKGYIEEASAPVEQITETTNQENEVKPVDSEIITPVIVAESNDNNTVDKEKKAVKTSTEIGHNTHILYKVQILYSANQIALNDQVFNDFNDIEEIAINGKYKYLVGSKGNYNEAVEYSKWVKSRHPDAFIVAVMNGKIIPLSQALQEENSNKN